MPDVTIIGGGPAGSAAAIRLARAGRRVVLYEKAAFPRPKLCGGFLSPESLNDLDDLDVLSAIHALNTPQITRSVVVSQTGTRIENALPEPAYSVSRATFDHRLIQQAEKEGVHVVWGQDGFDHIQEGVPTVIAAGRLHRNSRSLNPELLSPWYYGSSVRYVGLQALFQGARGMTDQVELDIVPSGYVGLARQAEGINVCALTTEQALKARGSDLDSLLKLFMAQNRALQEHLESATRMTSWMTVGPVRLGIRNLAERNRFYIGDAACVLDPFTGEGMAMGLYASRLLVKALDAREERPEDAYRKLWRQAFCPALRWNAVMRALYSVPFLREPGMKALALFPTGMQWMTDLTRYREILT